AVKETTLVSTDLRRIAVRVAERPSTGSRASSSGSATDIRWMDEATAASGPERARIDADPVSRTEKALADLSLLALSDVDVQTLLTATSESVRQALAADFASVLELLPGRDELCLRAGSGWGD